MKRFLQTMMMLPVFGITYAQQLPNAGFENWHTYAIYTSPTDSFLVSDPNAFYSLNLGTTGYDISGTVGATKSTDSHSGSYALRLTSGVFDLNPLGFPIVDTSAIVALGLLPNGPGQEPIEGVPFTFRPTKFSFWYKYQPVGTTDTAIVSVRFSNSVDGDIGRAEYKIFGSAVNTYTKVEVDINWDSPNMPDTVEVGMASGMCGIVLGSDPIDGSQIGNTLYIDDLLFVYGTTGINEAKTELDVTVSPNPASDRLTISFKEDNKGETTLNIYNVLGSLALTKTINQNNEQIDVRDLQSGHYIVELKNDLGSSRKRVLINK